MATLRVFQTSQGLTPTDCSEHVDIEHKQYEPIQINTSVCIGYIPVSIEYMLECIEYIQLILTYHKICQYR